MAPLRTGDDSLGGGCVRCVDARHPLQMAVSQGLDTRSRTHREAKMAATGVSSPSGTDILPEEQIAIAYTWKDERMSNEEIAVRLAAAILEPSVAVPARRANVDVKYEQIQSAAELAVRVYKTVLGVLQPPESA